jgi:hypothetical protein
VANRAAREAHAVIGLARRRDMQAIRAALWALQAARAARLSLRRGGLKTVALPPPPALDAGAGRGVDAALRRTRYSCLERALVRQAWAVAHGQGREVVIGVTGVDDFGAHAWLDGDPPTASTGFREIMRYPPPAGAAS